MITAGIRTGEKVNLEEMPTLSIHWITMPRIQFTPRSATKKVIQNREIVIL